MMKTSTHAVVSPLAWTLTWPTWLRCWRVAASLHVIPHATPHAAAQSAGQAAGDGQMVEEKLAGKRPPSLLLPSCVSLPRARAPARHPPPSTAPRATALCPAARRQLGVLTSQACATAGLRWGPR